jgi:DNA ligase (NAD+)
MEHLFSWLAFTPEQLQSIRASLRSAGSGCGISSTLRANGLFLRWIQAMGVPIPNGVAGLKEDDWQRMQDRNEEQWRRLPGIGENERGSW